jgi:hypothetical protein
MKMKSVTISVAAAAAVAFFVLVGGVALPLGDAQA